MKEIMDEYSPILEGTSSEELNERIATIQDDNALLIDKKEEEKETKDKKPKPILS